MGDLKKGAWTPLQHQIAAYWMKEEDWRGRGVEKLTTPEIGRRLGLSKNVIIGNVRRLGLEPRESSIKPLDTSTFVFTPDGDAMFRKMWADGARRVDIGVACQMTIGQVVHHTLRLGLPVRQATRPISGKTKRAVKLERRAERAAKPPMDEAAFKRDHDAGFTLTQLARKFGIRDSSVRRLCVKLSLTRWKPKSTATGNGSRVRQDLVPKVTLPPVGRLQAVRQLREFDDVEEPEKVQLPPRPQRLASVVPTGRVISCLWPTSATRFQFSQCDKPSVPGRVYCGEHCQRAYQGFRAEEVIDVTAAT